VFTKPEGRFLLPFPFKSKVKDSAVLLIVTEPARGLTITVGSLSKEL
jgi:hypothetical protein